MIRYKLDFYLFSFDFFCDFSFLSAVRDWHYMYQLRTCNVDLMLCCVQFHSSHHITLYDT